MFKNYGPLCTAVYDLTKPIGSSLNGDVDYYRERLSSIDGPILEIGVGTGRMMIPLAQAGHSLTGIDLSDDMLTKCRSNLTKAGVSGQLVAGDFTESLPTGLYDAVIIPTSTLNLITDYTKVTAGLEAIFSALLPGGKLILDLDLPFYPEVGEVQTSTFPLSETTGIVMTQTTLAIDWVSQTITSHIRYEKWHEGALVASELQDLSLRWFGTAEFRLLLQSIGFTAVTLSADYEYGLPVTDANQTLTFEAVKPLTN